ncbi:hypothetical protein [Streptomyces gardneri]|uniref:Uncharacterized protein n=1 Tax=Streptomyces gardneri TaxID=66892 RepID=A0A4Y3RHX1_9ACTN|nr:hypothetical protein [Streptomyces gardneri]GEB57411.1 hypothetical protein SGA01_30160 [Streptomyces gardneri]GHH12757.1 hypothetical protein GCM10017674_59070 [Streptomyces gardneri]
MSTSRNDITPSSPGPLVSQRAATIGTAAAVIGGVIGALAYVEMGTLAGAVIAGLVTFGASARRLNTAIGS